jgi:hypothetical protein
VEDVSAVSVIGIAGMVLSLAAIALKLCLTPRPPGYVPPELVHTPRDLSAPLVAVFDAVFTFGGQVNWVRCPFLLSIAPRSASEAGSTSEPQLLPDRDAGSWRRCSSLCACLFCPPPNTRSK